MTGKKMNLDGIPMGSPLVNQGPYLFQDSQIHIFVFKAAREEIIRGLPEGYAPQEPAVLWLTASRHRRVRAGDGMEQDFENVTILTPVCNEEDHQKSFFFLYSYSNRDAAVATGREVYGMPCKGAHISLGFDERTRVLECRLSRRDVDLIHVTARGIEGDPREAGAFPTPYFKGLNPLKNACAMDPDIQFLNRKHILDVEGRGPGIREITAVSPVIHQSRLTGSYATESIGVEFGSLAEDPLQGFGEIHEVLAGLQWACAFTLPYGSVIRKES